MHLKLLKLLGWPELASEAWTSSLLGPKRKTVSSFIDQYRFFTFLLLSSIYRWLLFPLLMTFFAIFWWYNLVFFIFFVILLEFVAWWNCHSSLVIFCNSCSTWSTYSQIPNRFLCYWIYFEKHYFLGGARKNIYLEWVMLQLRRKSWFVIFR